VTTQTKRCDCGCGLKLPKGRTRFFSNKHKDKFHNRTNPRGYGLRTRPQDESHDPDYLTIDDIDSRNWQ